jgi:calmodulin
MRVLGQKPSDIDIVDMITEVDSVGVGEIYYEEYKKLMSSASRNELKEKLYQVFKMFIKVDSVDIG